MLKYFEEIIARRSIQSFNSSAHGSCRQVGISRAVTTPTASKHLNQNLTVIEGRGGQNGLHENLGGYFVLLKDRMVHTRNISNERQRWVP